jgi:hypothetical protein
MANRLIEDTSLADEAEEHRQLEAAEATFYLSWEILATTEGIFVAVPVGTKVIRAESLDALVRRLRTEPTTEPQGETS